MVHVLANDMHRCATNVPVDEHDFFACEAFREIIYATWPVPKANVLGDMMVSSSHNDMRH